MPQHDDALTNVPADFLNRMRFKCPKCEELKAEVARKDDNIRELMDKVRFYENKEGGDE